MIDLENVDIEIVEVKIQKEDMNRHLAALVEALLTLDDHALEVDSPAIQEAA